MVKQMLGRCVKCQKDDLTKRQAIRAALQASFRYGHGMTPYRCPHGGHWHLTSKGAKRR